MALLGLQRYYKRSGDSFYAMEHFDLEDMFGRRKRPVLEVIYQIQSHPQKPQIKLGIKNRGRGSAPAPYFAFTASGPFSRWEYGLDGNGNEGLKRLPYLGATNAHRYGADTTYIIHPGMEQWITSVALPGFGRDAPTVPREGLTINYEIASEGFPLIANALRFTYEQLIGSQSSSSA